MASNSALLAVDGVTKTFPGVVALNDVSFALGRGEVHALLGENGAGKSTLLKILSGAQPADSGRILLDGQPFDHDTPLQARQSGLATIYQEFSLVPPLSVAENIFLGRAPLRGGMIDYRRMRHEAMAALERIGLAIDPDRAVSSLSVAEQQLVEIARALSFNARIIIMDEPTAALSGSEVDRLLDIVRDVRAQQVSVIYVTHRLSEVFRICDRYTVLRDGEVVTSGEVAEVAEEDIIRSMVGREFSHLFKRRGDVAAGAVALQVEQLWSLPNLRDPNATEVRDVSFQARYGEILGIAGLVGAGRTETIRMLFGADQRKAGRIRIDGREVAIHSPRHAIGHGIGLVTEDRKQQGCFLDLSVLENMSIASLSRLCNRLGIVDQARERRAFEENGGKLNIKMTGPRQPIGKLSGGNQQKVIIARWLMRRPKILIVDEPTRGIDVSAKAQVHDILFGLAREGLAVIVISSELPELLTVSDRILTMCEGRVTGEFSRDDANEESLMMRMAPRSASTAVNEQRTGPR